MLSQRSDGSNGESSTQMYVANAPRNPGRKFWWETRHKMLIFNWSKHQVLEIEKFVCGGSTEMQLMFLKTRIEYKGLRSRNVHLVDESDPPETS